MWGKGSLPENRHLLHKLIERLQRMIEEYLCAFRARLPNRVEVGDLRTDHFRRYAPHPCDLIEKRGEWLVGWRGEKVGRVAVGPNQQVEQRQVDAITGVIGGAFSDRWDRRKLMLVADVLRAAIVGVLPLLHWLWHVEYWHLIAVALGLSTVRAFFYPSLLASVADLVPENQLTRANALLHGSFQVSGQAVGPLLAGLLLGVLSPFHLLALDAGTFLISSLCLLFIRLPTRSALTMPGSVLEDVRALRQTLRNRPDLAWAIGFFGLEVAAISGVLQVGLPLLAQQLQPGNPQGYAVLLGVMGSGAIAATVMLQWLTVRRYAAWVFGGWVVWGVVQALLGLMPTFGAALVLIAVLGLIGPLVNVPMTGFIQTHAPPTQRGKIFSLWSTVANVGDSVSAAATGVLLAAVPLAVVFMGSGLVAAGLGVWGYRRVARMPKIEDVLQQSSL